MELGAEVHMQRVRSSHSGVALDEGSGKPVKTGWERCVIQGEKVRKKCKMLYYKRKKKSWSMTPTKFLARCAFFTGRKHEMNERSTATVRWTIWIGMVLCPLTFRSRSRQDLSHVRRLAYYLGSTAKWCLLNDVSHIKMQHAVWNGFYLFF